MAGNSTMRTRVRRLAGVATASSVLLLAGSAPAQASLLGGLLGTVTSVIGTAVGVVSTALDTTTGLLTGADWGYAASQTPLTLVNQSIGADRMNAAGYTGKGVGVALIDTGVVPVKGLTSGNVVNGPDLSLDNAQGGLANFDGFGHGTHMAGIIAGNDGTSWGFKGVAPGATLLSVKVGAYDGAVDVSQVIAGIDWVVQHRNDNGMNIRVINLSYGTDGVQSYQVDPLAAAVEHAWQHGITVVVAGGNRGVQTSLDNPATDPYVIAVGADDPNGTATSLDDSIPDFSQRSSDGRHVDVVAPGQSIVSLRDPGSIVDSEYPGAVVNTRFFKGSGTSQATAVVSGAVALLLQQRPSLTPDQVKALLMSTAQPVPLTDATASGAGLVNVYGASTALAGSATQTWPRSTGLGTLEGARGSAHVADNDGSVLTGEQDVFGDSWQPSVWAPASAAGAAWSGGVWNGGTWTGSCWCGSSWTASTWSGAAWSGNDWSGSAWSAQRWSAQRWSSGYWSGSGWTAQYWSAQYWSSQYWSGQRWSGAMWS